jgi:hypothetical protein
VFLGVTLRRWFSTCDGSPPCAGVDRGLDRFTNGVPAGNKEFMKCRLANDSGAVIEVDNVEHVQRLLVFPP